MADELTLIQGLRTRDILAFKTLVVEYSEDMLILAYLLCHDHEKAAFIVDEILMAVYAGSLANSLTSPLHPFFMAEVRKACGY
jgi:hypothetical protein